MGLMQNQTVLANELVFAIAIRNLECSIRVG